MTTKYGHFGDAFADLRRIVESLPAGLEQRENLEEFARGLALLAGQSENLRATWPEICNEL